jgi:outer membrane immunogenic protein
MKKFWLGSAALFFLSAGVAGATDLPIKPPVYKAVDPFSWSGFYVGAHAGYGWGDFTSLDTTFGALPSGKLQPSGWLGGVQFGYNSQFAPHWLLGGEIDFSASDLQASGTTTSATALPINLKVDYLGTGRTRLGYVTDRSLIYVTGGVAWTHDKFSELAGGVPQWFPGEYRVGWTIGGGYEYAFDAHWSAKVEYLYADLGHYSDVVNGSLPRTNELTMNIVRVGLNYRFGDSTPGDPAPRMPVKAYSPRFSWTGGYLGAHVGYAWADPHSFDGFFGPAQTSSVSPSGWLGGFQGGYNWQLANNWVVGFETDSSFNSLSQNGVTSPGAFPTSFKVEDSGTIRGRLGYAVDRTLVYGTGGLAYAQVKFTEIAGAQTGMGLDANRIGWTAGAGLEYAFTADWSAKIEYLYADLGTQQLNFVANPRTVDLTMSTVKVGLNYHGPVLERLFGAQ